MNMLMDYIMKSYGFLIKKNKEGKQYASNEDIAKLPLNEKEKSFVRITFESKGIKCVDELIEKENRASRVRDYEYGAIENNGQQAFDKAVIATIMFEGESITFEDYTELDDFIINEFIPSNVVMKVNRTTNTKGGEVEKPYLSIQLNKIVALKLSEIETKRVIEVIGNEGIRIGGTSTDMDSIFTNYDYIRTYATMHYPEVKSWSEMKEKFIEFYETRDPVLREELIVRNMRLIPYSIWKIAALHNIDSKELESYAYEGLIYAVENFDPYLNCRFSTYAYPCIRGYVRSGIPKIKETPSNIYYEFNSVKYIVEKEWGKKYDGDAEMLDDILEIMISQGLLLRKDKSMYWSIFKPEESLDEIMTDTDVISSFEIDDVIFFRLALDKINETLDTLTIREKEIIKFRFGLNDGRYKTLEEVGKAFNISPSRVSQLIKKGLRKLRHPMRRSQLENLLKEMNGDGFSSEFNPFDPHELDSHKLSKNKL